MHARDYASMLLSDLESSLDLWVEQEIVQHLFGSWLKQESEYVL